MNWFYVDQGQQAGPVDDAQLDQLHASGIIQPATLVWREGMANWAPYSEARPAAAPAPGLRLAGSAGSTGYANESAGGAQATCTQCGGVFPVSELIHYGTAHVCANCKPVFMQKLAEGAKIQSGMLEYATIGSRFGAMILDWIILGIAGTAVQFAIGFMMGVAEPDEAKFWALQALLIGVPLLMGLVYETWMVGAYGATVGKMACKIKVVTAEGGQISYPRACGRHFAKYLSRLICMIGYLMAFFDKEERRTLHDRICNTRVVVK